MACDIEIIVLIVVLYSIQQSVVFLLLFLCETLFQQSGWHTANDGVGRKGLREHCSGSNDRTTTYGDTLQYCHIRTYPHVILDYYCGIIPRQFLSIADINDVFAYDVYAVVARDNSWTWTEYNLSSNSQRRVGTIESAALGYGCAVANGEVLQAFDV